MGKIKKFICLFLLFNFLFLNTSVLANTYYPDKYPNYGNMFLGEDKYENFNRKVFNVNLKLNKIFVRKIHVLWASTVPNFLIDCLTNAYTNIEYPKRLISCLLQQDKDAALHETKRFFINTTFGLGGLLDSAYKIFKLELYDEDMEQAFAKRKIKNGNYLVLPFVSSTTTRDLFGRLFDFLLTPTTYIFSPVAGAIKLGLLINRTAKIQQPIQIVESNYADSYDIAKKLYAVQKNIKLSNFDRANVLAKKDYDEEYELDEIELVNKKQEINKEVKGEIKEEQRKNLVVGENLILHDKSKELKADIILNNYNPQTPIIDAMRTAFFDIKKESPFWSDISIWRRSFGKKLKYADCEITKNGEKYNFKYILQKDKTSPLMIIFPSFGEGINSTHSTTLAEFFFKEGYSVLILGSHFQWEFLKSLEKDYSLGAINNDIKHINSLINNSISYLSKKYDRTFLKRIVFGTSLGAYAALFLANEQYQVGANNIDKFIAVCPPIELFYAINQMDKIIASWKNYPDDFSQMTAKTVSKVMLTYKNAKNMKDFNNLPFTNYEAKLISGYIFHQKLSDLIFQTEISKNPNANKKEIYNLIYSTDFNDYVKKYLLVNTTYDELYKKTSLHSIANYLINKDNYKIFHSLDDYLTNKKQLRDLKDYCDNKLTLFNNGSHLGFLYRDEFLEALRKEIK